MTIRTISTTAILTLATTLACTTPRETPVADNVTVEGQKVVIEGVEGYKVVEPLFEAVGVVARYLGVEQSPEYQQGISGAAFRIAGICPCAPTCSFAMSTPDFARTLGFEVTHVNMGESCEDYRDLEPLAELYQEDGHTLPDPDSLDDPKMQEQARHVQVIIDSIKAGIRRGTPVVVWHAFTTAEYDVVCGYDDSTGEFLGLGSYGNPDDGSYMRALQGRMVEAGLIGGLPNCILFSPKSGECDARAAEIAALKEAVKHGRSQENVDKLGGEEWEMLQGIACYDRWSKDWENPEKKRGMGDAYCYGVYSNAHRTASTFLKEIAPSHGAAEAPLLKAAGCFAAESETLDKCKDLVWWSAPEGPDPERNKKAAALLGVARDHYAEGIGAIEEAVAELSE